VDLGALQKEAKNAHVVQKVCCSLPSHLTKEWDFPLHYYPFNEVYTKELWNRRNTTEVLSYIKDKQLLASAHQLQKILQQYSTIAEAVPISN